jgi:hypothetical protein
MKLCLEIMLVQERTLLPEKACHPHVHGLLSWLCGINRRSAIKYLNLEFLSESVKFTRCTCSLPGMHRSIYTNRMWFDLRVGDVLAHLALKSSGEVGKLRQTRDHSLVRSVRD